MECVPEYCRCCYQAGGLGMLSRLALDVYKLIFHSWGSKDDANQIFACFRCRQFLEAVHCFRDERLGDESGNLDFKHHKVDENSAKLDIKTEIIDEDFEIDLMDIQINKTEAYSDPETSQHMSETFGECLLVSNVEKSEIEVHNSLNPSENSLLIENRAIPYIETSNFISRPLKQLHKKNCDRPFKCNECSYEAINSSSLKLHIIHKHNEERPFSCDQCDYRSKTKWGLSQHMNTHLTNPAKPFKCNGCSYEAKTSAHMKSHIVQKHSDEKPFSCDQCDLRFKIKSKLTQHRKRHARPKRRVTNCDKSFKCNDCPFEAMALYRLKLHIIRKHSDVRPFSCDHCDYRSKTKWHLSQHMNTHLTNPVKPFKCNDCSYETMTSTHMKIHMLRKHSDERPFSCDQCDARFKIKSRLTQHRKRHARPNTRLKNPNRSFKCNECSFESMTVYRLKLHIIRKHSDERPFSCDQCEYRSKTKWHLSQHMNTHLTNPVKPFKCNDCSYEAKTSSHLKSHIIQKHSDERPFSCDQCDLCFKIKSKLTQHRKRHERNKSQQVLQV